MRVSLRAIGLLVSLAITLPAFPEPTKENFAGTLMKSAGSSAAGAIGMAVAKQLTGKFYDATCAKEITKDPAEQYFCNALAGFSGRDEQEWKAEIKKQLAEINTKLAALEHGQARLQHDLTQHHKEMYRLFKQAAAEQIATNNEAEFETLWKAYRREFDENISDVNREAMIKFARHILDEKLDRKLALYNTVLTTAFRGNQALLRYPFYDYKEKKAFHSPPEAFNKDRSLDALYDSAEKAFVDARMREEKVSLMVLWAIKVLESDCQMRTPCTAPPFSSAEFKKNYDAYTRDQLIAFNEGLDWLLFTYGNAHSDAWFLPAGSEDALTRANFLNASVAGGGNGMWGRVISMGNSWDGTLSVQCGSASGVMKPRFSYLVPVDGRHDEKEMDWWTSRGWNDVYDVVHFAKEWKVYHYYIPEAKEGPCGVSQTFPMRGTVPWIQPGTAVMKAKTAEKEEVVFGSFIAIQRAGGTYAMATGGQWRRRAEPFTDASGTTANIKNDRVDWEIDTSGRFPRASVLYEGRGEYKVLSGGRVHRFNQIYLYNDKKIYFPEDREIKLALLQGPDCAKTCRGGNTGELFILDYNIENGGTADKEKGKLDAAVSVFLSPSVASLDGSANRNIRNDVAGKGVFIDGSYGLTSERKEKRVNGLVSGSLKVEPNTGYHLQYLIEFDMDTEGHGAGATQWMYRGKITPAGLYLMK